MNTIREEDDGALPSFSFFKHKANKTHKKTTKKKTKRREGAYVQALILPSYFSFLLASSFFQKVKKKKKKNVEKRGNFPSSSRFPLSLLAFASAFRLLPSRFYLLTFGFRFCLPTFALLFQTFSLWHLLLVK
jgi:hypothetical protein